MNPARAVVRLLVVGSTFWIAFWLWNYTTKCIRSPKGSLFCPTADGDALMRTDYFHAAYLVFGPPLGAIILGVFCWWAIRETQKGLGSK
jgi:hypothetical protein